MFATVRRYLDVAPDAAAELERRQDDVTKVVARVPGLSSYEVVRTREGLIAVTVCSDEESAIEANRRVAAWLRANIQGFRAKSPEVWSGPVTVRVDGRCA